MIDPTTFATWMAALSDRFNRPLLPATQRAYYAALSAELSTEEFEQAASLAFRDETFWPSPKVIIEKVRPPADPKVAAGETFEGLRLMIAGLGRQQVDHRIEPTLAAPVRRALRAIGGVHTIAMAGYADLPHLARRFAECYEAAVRESPGVALPGAAEALRLTAVTGQKLLTE